MSAWASPWTVSRRSVTTASGSPSQTQVPRYGAVTRRASPNDLAYRSQPASGKGGPGTRRMWGPDGPHRSSGPASTAERSPEGGRGSTHTAILVRPWAATRSRTAGPPTAPHYELVGQKPFRILG